MNFPEVARAVDAAIRPIGNGYVAERHGLIPNLVLVWAPCGCVWGGDTSASFVTACRNQENCTYSYVETLEAVKALLAAEQAGPVELPKAADPVVEQQVSEMISEGAPEGNPEGTME